MSTIKQWIDDLALLPELNQASWQPFRHSSETTTLERSQLNAALADTGTVTGWITETSRVVELTDEVIELKNLPLAGEWFSGNNHWVLSQLPRGKWQLTHHQLQPCNADDANCLGQAVTHLHANSNEHSLLYWKLWQDTDFGPQAGIALLAAIDNTHNLEVYS